MTTDTPPQGNSLSVPMPFGLEGERAPAVPARAGQTAFLSGETKDVTSIDDLINMTTKDPVRLDVEAVALAPAHALLHERWDVLDDLVARVVGLGTESHKRVWIAAELLAGYCLSATSTAPSRIMSGLPVVTPEAPESFQWGCAAAGSLLIGTATGDSNRVAEARDMTADDAAVASDMVLALSMYLSTAWRQQREAQDKAAQAFETAQMPGGTVSG